MSSKEYYDKKQELLDERKRLNEKLRKQDIVIQDMYKKIINRGEKLPPGALKIHSKLMNQDPGYKLMIRELELEYGSLLNYIECE